MSLLAEKFVTLDKLVEVVPFLTIRTVKHWLATNPGRFRERCVMKIGGKLYYDLDAIERWMLDHKGIGVNAGEKNTQ